MSCDGSTEALLALALASGMGLPQYGHSPDVVPGSAATGIPQVGHMLSCTSELELLATALGLKHMIVPTFLSRSIFRLRLRPPRPACNLFL